MKLVFYSAPSRYDAEMDSILGRVGAKIVPDAYTLGAEDIMEFGVGGTLLEINSFCNSYGVYGEEVNGECYVGTGTYPGTVINPTLSAYLTEAYLQNISGSILPKFPPIIE